MVEALRDANALTVSLVAEMHGRVMGAGLMRQQRNSILCCTSSGGAE
jgi:predicted N-acetyltransferase YhbS